MPTKVFLRLFGTCPAVFSSLLAQLDIDVVRDEGERSDTDLFSAADATVLVAGPDADMAAVRVVAGHSHSLGLVPIILADSSQRAAVRNWGWTVGFSSSRPEWLLASVRSALAGAEVD